VSLLHQSTRSSVRMILDFPLLDLSSRRFYGMELSLAALLSLILHVSKKLKFLPSYASKVMALYKLDDIDVCTHSFYDALVLDFLATLHSIPSLGNSFQKSKFSSCLFRLCRITYMRIAMEPNFFPMPLKPSISLVAFPVIRLMCLL